MLKPQAEAWDAALPPPVAACSTGARVLSILLRRWRQRLLPPPPPLPLILLLLLLLLAKRAPSVSSNAAHNLLRAQPVAPVLFGKSTLTSDVKLLVSAANDPAGKHNPKSEADLQVPKCGCCPAAIYAVLSVLLYWAARCAVCCSELCAVPEQCSTACRDVSCGGVWYCSAETTACGLQITPACLQIHPPRCSAGMPFSTLW